MATTIMQKDRLKELREDTWDLSEQTLANIKKSEADIKAGRVHALDDVEKRLGT